MKRVNIPETNEQQRKTLLTIAIIVIMFLLFYYIAKRLGLIKGLIKTEKEKISEEKSTIQYKILDDEIFNPRKWQNAPNNYLLSDDLARKYAKDIYQSLQRWPFPDDVSKISGIFKLLTHRAQVSQIAFFYLSQFESELTADFKKYLNNDEIYTVYVFAKEVPN